MKTSYLYQAVNLVSSFLLLVLILAYLDPGRYLQWVLFTTIAGAAIQLEGSLSVVMTRYLSRARNAASPAAFVEAAHTVRRVYTRFSMLAALIMLIAGGAYLLLVDGARFSPTWPFEWLAFCAAYFIYYLYAHHCCMLIALDRVGIFAAAALASRILNVVISAGLVVAGFGVPGLVTGTALSFAAGAATYRARARRALADFLGAFRPVEGATATAATAPRFAVRTVFIHAAFVFGSYSLYRAGLLFLSATSGDTSFQASYGLALQLFTLITTVALIPVNMRVTPLVAAVTADDKPRIARELGILGLYVNLVYVAGAALLVAFSGSVDSLLPSRGASLPQTAFLAAIAIAFFVEINIFILVNALLAAQKYRFALDYYLSAGLAVVAAVATWELGLGPAEAFVLVPAAVQASICFPALCRRVRRETGVRTRDYLRALADHGLLVLRHPIKVGLAFR